MTRVFYGFCSQCAALLFVVPREPADVQPELQAMLDVAEVEAQVLVTVTTAYCQVCGNLITPPCAEVLERDSEQLAIRIPP